MVTPLLALNLICFGQCDWEEAGVIDLSLPVGLGEVSAVRNTTGLFLAATARDSTRTWRIVLRTLDGREDFASDVKLTDGEYDTYAELVSDGPTIHLIWAGLDPSTPDPQGVDYYPTTLYWSTFADGLWSPPRTIFEDKKGIRWSSNEVGGAVVDGDGALHILVPLVTGGRLVYLRKQGASWTRGKAPRETAAYVDLWTGKRDTIYALVVGAALDRDHARPGDTDANSVLFFASYDNGDTWREPVLVSRSGDQQASFPDLTVSESGVLHVAWGKNLSGGPFPEVIWTSSSLDGGTTWLEPEEIDYGSGFLRDLDLVETCHRLAILLGVIRSSKDRNFGVYGAHRNASGWSEPRLISHGLGYSVTESGQVVSDLVIQSIGNEEEVLSAPPGRSVMPEIVLRHFKPRVERD